MIHKEGVRIIYTCDSCGSVRRDQDGVRASWRPNAHAWKDAQAIGWTAKKMVEKSDWNHYCPDCNPMAKDADAQIPARRPEPD